MALQKEIFNTDLAALGSDEYQYTTSFGADAEIGQVMIRAQDVSGSTAPTGSQSPVYKGVQETIEIWYDNGSGENYDTLLFAGSFNGRENFVWAPEGGKKLLLDSGSELLIVITNKHGFGHLYGTVIVNTI